MRLQRLDLVRYGKFTDARLDFGTSVPGQPDLHVVWGPNEAGKSTICAAYLDLLFGIPHTSGYAFLHGYESMQIGASIATADGIHELVRVKKRNASLFDGAGRPVADALLGLALGGIDRDAYGAMFHLDDDTLERGGESILRSQNDLGRILFSATAGLTGTAAAAESLRRRAEEFYKPHASRALNALKNRVEALADERREHDLAASTHVFLREERERCEVLWGGVHERLESARAELLRLERLAGLVPVASELAQARAALAALADLPHPPGDLAARLESARGERTTLVAARTTEEAALSRLADERSPIVRDEPALALAPLREEIEARYGAYEATVSELPVLREEAQRIEGEIAEILIRLDADGESPDDLVLPAPTLALLRALASEHVRLEAQEKTSRDTLERCLVEREVCASATGEPADEAATSALASLLESIEALGPDTAVERARADLAEASAALDRSRRDLADWGTLDTASPILSRDEVEALESALARALDEAERARLRVETLRTGAWDAADADVRSTRREAVMSDVARAREARERAWTEHLGRLDAQSALRFEETMRQDDALVAALVAAEVERIRDRALAEEADRDTALARRAHADLAEASAALTGVREKIAAGLPGLRPAALETARPGAVRTIVDGLRRCRESEERLRAANRAAEEATETLARTRLALATRMTSLGARVGDEEPFAALLSRARTLLARAEAGASARETLARADRAVEEARRALARVVAEREDWRARYDRAVSGTRLETAPVLPEALATILDELGALADACRRRREDSARLARLEEVERDVAARIGEAARALGLTVSQPDRAWREISGRVGAAVLADREERRLAREIGEAQRRIATLERDLDATKGRIAGLCGEVGVADEATLAETIEACARRDEFARRVTTLEGHVRDTMGARDLEEALQELGVLDADLLAARSATARESVERLAHDERAAHDALEDVRRRIEAVGGDGAAARIEQERRTALVSIEAGARACLRDRLAALVLDDALRRYRESHRGAMMTRASEAFVAITGGAYVGLSTRVDREKELLVALPREGGSRLVDQLSKGTRFQLYLALRVAAYEQVAASGRAVPFVADDIMETFDEERSARTFEALARMACSGQVVYLTHHRHLVEIAREVCPSVRVHDLTALASPGPPASAVA